MPENTKGATLSENERPRRNASTLFAKGNELWKRRLTTGPNPIFDSPEDLLDACCEYFQWAQDNPLWEEKAFAYEGVVSFESVAKARVFTLVALCAYIGITMPTWGNWRRDKPEYKDVIAWAESIIYSNKFEGASAGLYNSNIIARDLGLADRNELSGPNGGPIQTEVTSARDILASKLSGLTATPQDEGTSGGTDGAAS